MSDEQRQRYGAVRFDTPAQHTTGWASIAGGPPTRIPGTEALPSDVCWMAININYDLLYASGLHGHARFRRGDFLGETAVNWRDDNTTSPTLMRYLGIADDDWPGQVQTMSALFDRVMRLSERFMHLSEVPLWTLREGVRQMMMGHDPVWELPTFIEGLNESDVPFAFCEIDGYGFEGRRPKWLWLPPIDHMRTIVSMPYPSFTGAWAQLDKRELPKSYRDVESWIAELPGPALVRVVLDDIDPVANKIINFGTGRHRRRWLTTPEVYHVLNLARITVKEAWVCREMSAVPGVAEVKEFLDQRPELGASLSVNLFAHNLWQAAATKSKPPAHVLKSYGSHPLWSPFIRAYDRMACFSKALELELDDDIPVRVVSYGKGKVSVITDADDATVAAIAIEHGLLPPLGGAAKESLPVIDMNNPTHLLQMMLATGAKEQLMEIDEVAVEMLLEDDAS